MLYPGATSKEILSHIAQATESLAKAELREKCEASLLDYAEYVWPIVDPATPFIRGWVLEAICEHLEAVSYGHIKRLLINVPPGFTKSLMTDVFWPSWEWGPLNRPWLRYICASYSNHLTERDNLRCRNIVVNDRYQKLWGNRFGISNAQFTKIQFANDKTGWKLATSVGGIGVGERGDRFIIDDANNTMEMESELVRATTNMWFTEVVPDRLNSQKDSVIVVIQQRLHEDDVSGTALSRSMGYTHLMIPMEHDPKRHCVTVLGTNDDNETVYWEDPRETDLELAWPERFPQDIVDDLKRDKGPYAWAGQYDQMPVPRGGAIIKSEQWQLWDPAKNDDVDEKGNQLYFPRCEYILASLDTAYTEKEENDASALTIWGVFRDTEEYPRPVPRYPYSSMDLLDDKYGAYLPRGNPKVILLAAWQDRLSFPALALRVLRSCTIDKGRGIEAGEEPRLPVDMLLIESKAAGISVAQELYRIIGGRGLFGIDLVDPKKFGDKVARVHAIQHLFHDKMIYAPNRAYADLVINQCAIFPKGSHDDLVDSTSMALRYLRDAGFALMRDEYRDDIGSDLAYKQKLQPLYDV